MREYKRRSIVKAISWRLTGTLDTTILAYLITRELKWAVSIGLIELITKTALYYFHERLWNRIKFGRITSSNDDYVI